MANTAGIVGAGLIGRMLGLKLAWRGWGVTLFDKDTEQGTASCTHVSAGMIAPACELETAERDISTMGLASLEAWPRLLEQLDEPVFFRCNGSIVVAHGRDSEDLRRLQRRIEMAAPHPGFMRELSRDGIRELEPELAERFHHGLYMAREAHVDNRQVLSSLAATLKKRGATWFPGAEIARVGPHTVYHEAGTHTFDWVVDTRGMGAKPDLPDLRGVRGEIMQVSAPDVSLQRPVRLMHPRYPIYIVPRENHVYVIGATALESEDYSPVSVRSTLELLSAAYTVHSGFAEARVLEAATQCRPAFPDNHPKILHRDGLLRVNGLYRHGFLLSPALSEYACDFLDNGTVDPEAVDLFQEVD